MAIHSIITVTHSVHAPWCNRRVGPGVYEVPGDARRFFRNIADTKLLAYGHCHIRLVDLGADAVVPAPVVIAVVEPVVATVVSEPVVEAVTEVAPAPVVEPVVAPVVEPVVENRRAKRAKNEPIKTDVIEGTVDGAASDQ